MSLISSTGHVFSVLFSILLFQGFPFTSHCLRTDGRSQNRAPNEKLTSKEELVIREIVFKGRAEIFSEGSFPQKRGIVIPKELAALYSNKRESTLRLLLDIISGGRQADVCVAASYALALTEDPFFGFSVSNIPDDIIDDEMGKTGETFRQRLRDIIRSRIPLVP